MLCLRGRIGSDRIEPDRIGQATYDMMTPVVEGLQDRAAVGSYWRSATAAAGGCRGKYRVLPQATAEVPHSTTALQVLTVGVMQWATVAVR